MHGKMHDVQHFGMGNCHHFLFLGEGAGAQGYPCRKLVEFQPMETWDKLHSESMSVTVPRIYDNEANTNALRLINVSSEECQKGIAPVSLPLLSHFALRVALLVCLLLPVKPCLVG
jgi:hypothetical protein